MVGRNIYFESLPTIQRGPVSRPDVWSFNESRTRELMVWSHTWGASQLDHFRHETPGVFSKSTRRTSRINFLTLRPLPSGGQWYYPLNLEGPISYTSLSSRTVTFKTLETKLRTKIKTEFDLCRVLKTNIFGYLRVKTSSVKHSSK